MKEGRNVTSGISRTNSDGDPVPTPTTPLLSGTMKAGRSHVPLSKQSRKINSIRRESHRQQPVLRTLLQTPNSRSALISERTVHSFVYTMLNPRSRQFSAQLFKMCITGVIIIDLMSFIISTEPKYKELPIFLFVEGITSTIFLVEYIGRLVTCMESKYFKEFAPVYGRLRYLSSWSALIDTLATLPFFIEYFCGLPLPTLTYLRIFRILRILKTQSFSNAMDAVIRVIFYNRAILWVAFILCTGLVLTTAVLMYYLRPPGELEDFESIGSTIYIATLMLTGQGGPDATNLPWYTKGVVLLTGVFSIGMFAIPASMLTWGFEAEAARLAAAARRKRSGKDPESSSSSEWTSSANEDSSDEEYQKIIAGEDEDTDEEIVKHLKQVFTRADVDKSGLLTQSEFIEQLMNEKQTMPSWSNHSVHMQGIVQARGHQSRMGLLEQKVDAMNIKLDQLLALLQTQEEGQ